MTIGVQALPIEPEAASIAAFGLEPFLVSQLVENAVEGRNGRGPGREKHQLERGADGSPARVKWQSEVGPKVVRAGDQGRSLPCNFRRCQHAGGGLDHRQHRLARSFPDATDQLG